MESFTFNIIADGAIIETATLDAKSETAALNKIKAEIKKNGGNPANFTYEHFIAPKIEAEAATLENPADELKIILSPANSPAMPGEAKRIYPPSIKHETLGTFWGCDNEKLLGTIRLNPHALDHYAMRQTGTRANFYLGTTLIWTTTKPIAALAHEMALALIAELQATA